MRVSGTVWKLLGVAGVAGVAATGAVIARDQRRRTALTPDQVRKQLRSRLADLERDPAAGGRHAADVAASTAPSASTAAPVKLRLGRRRR